MVKEDGGAGSGHIITTGNFLWTTLRDTDKSELSTSEKRRLMTAEAVQDGPQRVGLGTVAVAQPLPKHTGRDRGRGESGDGYE